MSSSPLPFDPEQSKAERVYNDLRRRIRELVLPPGAPLRKEEIALALGVSRAPVSEAIARLADEALAEHRRLVDAIRSQDPEFAAAAMRAHLSMVARAVERELAEIEAKTG